MLRLEHISNTAQLFTFDLEFIGDVRKLETCRIWEIAVYSVNQDTWFSRVVEPDKSIDVFPPPPIPEIPQLERSFLTANNAQTWDIVFKELEEWVSQCVQPGMVPILISHNTFRADKPILELECKRYQLRMPAHWYFFDSLHFSRNVISNTLGNYSLSGLYQQLFLKPIQDVHRAKSDVDACNSILKKLTNDKWDLAGPVYPVYTTSLRSIRWVGRKAENVFFLKNIRSVESLFMLVKHNIQQDYLQLGLYEKESVQKSIQEILAQDLPADNIKNITAVLLEMLTEAPFSYVFMPTTFP